jgi:hypothetical protein
MMKGRVGSIAAVLAVSAWGLAMGSTAAFAAEGGTVTGTVVSATTGKPLKGICVNIVEAKENQTVGTSQPTPKTGVWTLSNIVPSTTYTAAAFHCAGGGDYAVQWYDQQDFQSNATDFTVSSGLTTSNIDFSLSAGGEATGKVTNATTKKPVAGILVVGLYTTAFQTAAAACTTSNGKYKLTGAPTSGLYVEFLPNDCGVTSNFSSVWYLNSPSYGSATFVPITANKTTKDINQAVSEG